jgi:hypothetical protein
MSCIGRQHKVSSCMMMMMMIGGGDDPDLVCE